MGEFGDKKQMFERQESQGLPTTVLSFCIHFLFARMLMSFPIDNLVFEPSALFKFLLVTVFTQLHLSPNLLCCVLTSPLCLFFSFENLITHFNHAPRIKTEKHMKRKTQCKF